MRRVIGKKLYDTETATLLADDTFSGGSDRMPNGRATYLYRAPKGTYFAHRVTCWQGEHDWIEPLSMEDAVALYERLNDGDAADFTNAFPDVKIEDA